MSKPKIRAFGITQDGFTNRWKATGYVEGVGWLEGGPRSSRRWRPCKQRQRGLWPRIENRRAVVRIPMMRRGWHPAVAALTWMLVLLGLAEGKSVRLEYD
jgi:hypothetical protein